MCRTWNLYNINFLLSHLLVACEALPVQTLPGGNDNTSRLWLCWPVVNICSHINTHTGRFSANEAHFDQFGNCKCFTRRHTHTHTLSQSVPSSLSREPFSDFHFSFFVSGLLFLLSFPFSFTPFCFLFFPCWVFSAGRHRTRAQVKDVDLPDLDKIWIRSEIGESWANNIFLSSHIEAAQEGKIWGKRRSIR